MSSTKQMFQELFETFELNAFSSISTEIKKNTSQEDYFNIKSPIDQSFLASVKITSKNDYDEKINLLKSNQKIWRRIPAPQRGEIIRLFGNELRALKKE